MGVNTGARKPIQIIAPSGKTLFALCDDGTIWVAGSHLDGWTQLPEIPQAVEPQDEAGAEQ